MVDPMEMKYLNPTCCCLAQSRTAVQSAPDCDTNAMSPASGVIAAKDTFTPAPGLIIPRQFGPISRMLYVRQWERMISHIFRPSSPASANPAEMMISPGTFALPHCSTTPGTAGAGMQITARSTGSGVLAMFG